MTVKRAGLWRHPDFLKLWAAETISQTGSQVTLVALPLIAALTLDATPFQMGLLAAAGTAPVLLIGLFVGVWVDRLRRRPLRVAADLGRAALLAAIPVATVLDVLSIPLLIVVAFAVGMLNVWFNVSYTAFLPALVDPEQLIDGNSKIEASASMAQIAGPGLAGFLIRTVSAPFAILIDAVSFLGSGVLLARIAASEPHPTPAPGERSMRGEIAEGLRLVGGDARLRAMAATSATTNLFGYMFLAVYVLYMTRDLGLGAGGVGFVFAMGGVGAFLGALIAAPAARRFGLGRSMVGAQLLVGLGGLAIPVAVTVPRLALPLVVGAEFFQWMMLIVYFLNALSLRQAITPDRLRGRVNATMQFLVWGMQPIGSLLGGISGGVIGVPATLVVGVAGMFLAVTWLVVSPVRALRDFPTSSSEMAAQAVGVAD